MPDTQQMLAHFCLHPYEDRRKILGRVGVRRGEGLPKASIQNYLVIFPLTHSSTPDLLIFTRP